MQLRPGIGRAAGLQYDKVRLGDCQIERYSRQIVLPEIGAEGQCRLLEARVAVIGTSPVAGDVVAQLVAAGIGSLTAPANVHGYTDPAQQARVTSWEAVSVDTAFDVVALLSTDVTTTPAARYTLWLAGGRIGETPPCAACVARALLPAPSCDTELAGARDGVLASLLATEIIKRLVDVGTPLAGRTLTYDPGTASLTVEAVSPDPACIHCAPRPPED